MNRSDRPGQPLDAIAALYEAAGNEASWPQAVETIRRTLVGVSGGCHCACVAVCDESGELVERWHAHSESAPGLLELTYGGAARGADSIGPCEACEASRPAESIRVWFDLGEGARGYTGAMVAPASAGPARGLFETLRPHVARAVRMGRELETARTELAVARVAADGFARGVVLLDASAGMLRADRVADEILAAGDGLVCTDGAFELQRGSDRAAWREAIRRCVAEPSREVVFSAPRPSGARPYELTLRAVRAPASELAVPAPEVVVWIHDPDARRAPPSPATLRRLYGFTRTESRVVSKLASGSSPRQIAVALGMAERTARVHLTHAFNKTRTRGQVDLLRLVLGGAGG